MEWGDATRSRLESRAFELGDLTDDELDATIVRAEMGIAKLRALETAAIAEKRERKTHVQDGYRSIVDWVAARADVSHETARRLCWTATRLRETAEVAESLGKGEITFDRAEQVARLPHAHRVGHERYDISQLKRMVAHHKRVSRKREKKASVGYLQFQPASDEMSESIWGELPGTDGTIVKKAIDQRADEIFDTSAGLGVAERRALALVALCQESLYQDSLHDEPTRSDTGSSGVTVIVDAKAAAVTSGEAGVSVLNGPRIGRRALEAVVCDTQVEVFGIAADGESP